MTFLIRMFQIFLIDPWRKKISSLDDTVVHRFRILPFDIDVRFMNNAKYLHYFEVGRWGYALRSELARVMFKNGWSCPISKLSVQYFRPLKLFDPIELRTEIIHIEEKWMYFYHEILSKDKEVARALVRVSVRSKKENVSPKVYLQKVSYKKPTRRSAREINQWLQDFMLEDK